MKTRLFALAALAALSTVAFADEGMWTFDHVPKQAIRDKHGVELSDAWLDNVRLSTVRLETGCTGSFVSPDGLILTNHHCADGALAEHSTPQRDLSELGFLARSRDQELRYSAEQVSVLIGMKDVTAAVEKATAGLPDKRANQVRKQALSRLEKENEREATRDSKAGSVWCEAVTLYGGGQYMIYTYKRYDDVRLVWTPETSIAEFGGDPDNFQFPRTDLDLALLRAYENGKPARVSHWLPVDFAGPGEGEPVFVSGHPGRTQRMLTVAELRTLRDLTLPTWLLRSAELRGRLIQYGKTGAEQNRRIQDELPGLENSIKVRRKQLDALHDDSLLSVKRNDEQELERRVAADRALRSAAGDPWEEIARAQGEARVLEPYLTWIERDLGFSSRLYTYAKALVRGAAERSKPNDQRLREYADSQLPKLRQRLLAPRPVYPDVEKLTLSFSLERMREWLGPDDSFVKKLLGKDSPDSIAARLVDRTRLGDPAERKRLWEGGAAAVRASKDPMIELARRVDPEARAVHKRHEDLVEAPEQAGAEKIARARFKVYGTSLYPDATFTLRLNDGTVKGWVENGVPVKPFTTLATTYARATGQDPFAIPESWLKARSRLDPRTPFNLCTTNDIVGGNSGSPLIDARGRLVGVMFDGNIHSISGDYWFDATKNRAVAVHPAILREALDKVYGARALLDELRGAPLSAGSVSVNDLRSGAVAPGPAAGAARRAASGRAASAGRGAPHRRR